MDTNPHVLLENDEYIAYTWIILCNGLQYRNSSSTISIKVYS
jgi:hypothetical protein